ncbi:MAG: shikimate dehydrogenase [Acidimicrobiia bacterium]|nr:shikimate dehydrogenase [Acidimicrobiia bacterium]
MRYAVIGDPIAHSLSPLIHTAGFATLDIDAVYDRIRVPAGRFDEVVVRLRNGDLTGINVTMPHKHAAYLSVDRRTVPAERTAAVNTIVVSDGILHGDNTDVAGIQFGLEELGVPTDAPILVLGAGGAAGAALLACADRPVSVSARRREAVGQMVQRIDVEAGSVPWGVPVPGAVVVNATPLGMHGEDLPDGIIERAAGYLDTTYGHAAPARLRAAECGIPVTDGRSVLLGQAIAAFRRFTGREAPVAAMRAALDAR